MYFELVFGVVFELKKDFLFMVLFLSFELFIVVVAEFFFADLILEILIIRLIIINDTRFFVFYTNLLD